MPLRGWSCQRVRVNVTRLRRRRSMWSDTAP
jgi:hypothetical protein